MKNLQQILRRALFLVIVINFMLSSCSVEKKLGKEYLELRKDTVALMLLPDYVFKYNLKTYDFPGIDTLPQWQQDSILIGNSMFLKLLSDSAIISGFRDNFRNRLQQYHVRLHEESSLDSFLLNHQDGFVINIAQISLEEYIYPYGFDYDMVDESITVNDIDLNALNMNVWVEISRLNSELKNNVLFASKFIFDDLEGYFRQYLFTGNIQFEYTIDTLSVPQIYNLTNEMGTNCAGYLFDYFLNRYIQENVPETYPYELRPLHWDPVKSLFDYSKPEEQFIDLEQGNP